MKYDNVSKELRIQNAVCHRNLERCYAKYGSVSDEFRNTECSLLQ
jgi:hypothetical protein